MRKHASFITALVLAALPMVALCWWLAVSRVLVWWWTEMFLSRESMDVFQASWTFLAVTGLSVTAVPYFYWAPVVIYKELLWWIPRLRKPS